MKHQSTLIFGTLLATICLFNLRAESPDSAGNIVINGGMEIWVPVKPYSGPNPEPIRPEGLEPEGFDTSMEVEGDQTVAVKIAPDKLFKHGGDYSVRIENTEQEQTGDISLREISVEPNTKYMVRMWIKGEDIAVDKDPLHGAAIWVKYGPDQDFWGSPSTKSEIKIPELREGSFPWTKFEFTFDTLPDTALLRVYLQLRKATGKIWYDDLEVIPFGGKSVPVSNF